MRLETFLGCCGCAAIALSCDVATAQAVFNDAGADTMITTPGNWSAGLPTNGVTGTIGINAQYDSNLSLFGYDVVHTNATVSKGNGLGSLPVRSGSTWLMDGSSATLLGRGLTVDDGIFTLAAGNADLTENARDSLIDGDGSLIINGGTMSVGRTLSISRGNLTVNGGQLNVVSQMGGGALASTGLLALNGGDVTTPFLYFANDDFRMNVGGTNVGSLVIENFGNNRAKVAYIDINFDPGALAFIQLTNAVESGQTTNGGHVAEHGWSQQGSETGLPWAEALWGDGRLTFNGSNSTELGITWSVATNYDGLGDFYRWGFSNDTLSLVWEPPPEGTVIGLY